MSLYKAVFKIIKKNLLDIVIYFGITLGVLMLLNGVYADNESKKATLDKYNIYVENLDNSEYADAVVDFLKRMHNVKEEKLTEEQVKDLLYYQQVVAYVKIPEGFGDTFEKTGENRIVNMYDDAIPVAL